MEETIIKSVNNWLRIYKSTSVKEATYDRLKISAGLMSKYSISEIRLSDLKPADLQLYLNELVRDGYALSTIKKQHTLLTAFLKDQYAQGIIPSPLYLAVRMPSENNVRKAAKQIEIYTHAEQKKLLEELLKAPDDTCIACVLMLECGLRSGEVLSLTWDDIIFRRKAISIGKTLVKLSADHGRTFVQDSPKSRTSRRVIPVSDLAMAELEKLYSRNKTGFVFRKNSRSKISENVPASYAQLHYWLKESCSKADVPYYGCHALRHTFASNCYEKGADVKFLSKLLGHADVSITYNTYIHLFGDQLEELRKVIG